MNKVPNTWTFGTGKSVKWPAGIGAKGNNGVGGNISNTRPEAIGYINHSYIRRTIKTAALQNLDGEYLTPSLCKVL